MADYTYNPTDGTYYDQNGQVGTPGPTDTVTYGAYTGDYSVTLGSNVTVAQINISSSNATIVVPSGGTLNTNVTLTGNGTLQLGDPGTTSTATTTLNGSLSVNSGSALVNGNVLVGGPPGASISIDLGSAFSNLSLAQGANLTTQIPIAVTFYSLAGRGIRLPANSTLNLGYDTSTSQLNNLLSETNGSTGKVIVNGSIDNSNSTLNFVKRPIVSISNGTITGGIIVVNPTTQLGGVALNGVTVLGNLNVPGANYLFGAGLSGTGSVTVNGSLGVGTGKVDPLTINLEPNSLLYGEFGTGAVSVTFAAGTVINTFGTADIAFDTRYANSMVLQGSLNLLSSATPYTVSLDNSAGTVQFAAGSAVTIGQNALLAETTALDNETTIQLAGGTLELGQAPATLGTVQFYTANSTLQVGAFPAAPFAASGTLRDFSNTDSVVFYGATYGTSEHVSLSGTTLQVFDQNGTLDGTFILQRSDTQTYAPSNFVLGNWTGGTGIVLTTTGIAPLAAPVVTAGTTASFTGGGAAVTLDSGLTVSDPASTTLAGATVTLVSNFLAGDTINFSNQNGITGGFNAATGVLSLSGKASLANYQTALDSVTYSFSPTNGDPTDGGGLTTRTIAWSVNDGSVTSLAATSALDVTHAAPSITASGTVSFTGGGAAVVLAPGATVSDADSATLYSATVAITGGIYSGNGDMLAATTTGTAITAGFDPTSETLYLNGTDTLADYQAVLRSVTFSASGDPTNGGANTSRTIGWSVNDGVAASATASSGVTTIACFAAGTRIATEGGTVIVERLGAGDRVKNAAGGLAEVVWLGHRHIACRHHANPRLVWPVRVRAGAFGPATPQRDLFLSPDHAVFVDDVLIPIRYLINATSIAQVPVEEVTYYHVELAEHDVLLAEGLPVESYLDTGNRSGFANGGGPVTLHPDFSGVMWEAFGCAPLVVCGPELAAARDRLDRRAADLPRVSDTARIA